MRGLLTPAKIDLLAERIRAAAADQIEPKEFLRARLRSHLSKGETQAIAEAFNSPDVVNLPPGNSWRLSNAISFLANQTQDGERVLDLQRLAGQVAAAA